MANEDLTADQSTNGMIKEPLGENTATIQGVVLSGGGNLVPQNPCGCGFDALFGVATDGEESHVTTPY